MNAKESQQLRDVVARDTLARLETIPGIGLLTATALVAFVGDVKRRGDLSDIDRGVQIRH